MRAVPADEVVFIAICSLGLCLAAGAAARAGEDEVEALRFNPFSSASVDGASADGARGGAPAWAPTLHATLSAGDASSADLGGVVLRIGEETHGYRLVTVGLYEASFERGGERVVLRIPDATGVAQ